MTLLFCSSVLALSTSWQSAAGLPSVMPLSEQEFVVAVNGLRANQGIAPLNQSDALSEAARQWAYHLAVVGRLTHADDISAGAPEDWGMLGENVGRGANVDQLAYAFMHSPSHRDNLMSEQFTHLGIGVFEAEDGRLYTAQRFARIDKPAA